MSLYFLGVSIGSAAVCASPLTLGHMQGNRFKVRGPIHSLFDSPNLLDESDLICAHLPYQLSKHCMCVWQIRVRGVQACAAAGADAPPPTQVSHTSQPHPHSQHNAQSSSSPPKKQKQAPSLSDFVSRTSAGLRVRGFVNYFGSQRLGNPLAQGQMKTYELGRALLRRDFGEALRILLEPREADMPVREQTVSEVYVTLRDWD